jgi:hypothetical protein
MKKSSIIGGVIGAVIGIIPVLFINSLENSACLTSSPCSLLYNFIGLISLPGRLFGLLGYLINGENFNVIAYILVGNFLFYTIIGMFIGSKVKSK